MQVQKEWPQHAPPVWLSQQSCPPPCLAFATPRTTLWTAFAWSNLTAREGLRRSREKDVPLDALLSDGRADTAILTRKCRTIYHFTLELRR